MSILIKFNAVNQCEKHHNDRLAIVPVDSGFKAKFFEGTYEYEMFFQSEKEVAHYCHNFFDMLSSDLNPTYTGFTLNIPGFPAILQQIKTTQDQRDKIVQWIAVTLHNWPISVKEKK
jgi:hypothetical protein